MKKVMSYLRLDEWMSSKVTMMLGIQAYFICINREDITAAAMELIVYFLFLSMFLALSYVSNDFSDLEADRMAGKKNSDRERSPVGSLAVFCPDGCGRKCAAYALCG